MAMKGVVISEYTDITIVVNHLFLSLKSGQSEFCRMLSIDETEGEQFLKVTLIVTYNRGSVEIGVTFNIPSTNWGHEGESTNMFS